MASSSGLRRRSISGAKVAARAGTGTSVRNWLRGIGAPIVQAGSTDQLAPPLEELVAAGLHLTHTDASVARALPIVLWRNRARLRFDELARVARQEGEGATLGLFLDLTSQLTNDRELGEGRPLTGGHPVSLDGLLLHRRPPTPWPAGNWPRPERRPSPGAGASS